MSGSLRKRLDDIQRDADKWRNRAECLTGSLRRCHPEAEPRIKRERDAASSIVAAIEQYAATVIENRNERDN